VSAEPLLTLRSAAVSFGTTRALVDASLELRRGDRLALVGGNGSGKTTLLRLLHGLVAPDADRTLRAGPPRQAHLLQPDGRLPRGAMVFQRPFLLELSVRANVMLGLWLQGLPAAQRRQRCEQALALVGLEAHAPRRARALSGGQQQRLALARAWALQPDVLFLDEPTANLDPVAQREFEILVQRLAAEGLTLVLSTHQLAQARRLSTRVACLEAGRIVVERSTAAFFGDPGSLPPAARLFLQGELP